MEQRNIAMPANVRAGISCITISGRQSVRYKQKQKKTKNSSGALMTAIA